MNKAKTIRGLYDAGNLTVKEIANIVGCRVEYVRTCARQRRNGRSNADAAWLKKTGYRNEGEAQRARLAKRWGMEPNEAWAKYSRERYARLKAEAAE